MLLASLVHEEFNVAISCMNLDSAPGQDGFNPAFYKHLWDLCGDEIFQASSICLEDGFLPLGINDINIVLIRKCDSPTSMGGWRPISLYNVIYKILSKVLANRLKKVCTYGYQ